MRKPGILIFIFALLLSSCAWIADTQQPIKHIHKPGKPYLGIVFNQISEQQGIEIQRILPGPVLQIFKQQSLLNFESLSLIKVNQHSVNTSNLHQILNDYQPGETITLLFEMTKTNNEPSHTISLDIVLGDKTDWTGPIAKGKNLQNHPSRPNYLPEKTQNQIVRFIDSQTKQHEPNEQRDKLYQLFDEWQNNNRGFHSLSRVMFPFQNPESLIELEQTITQPYQNLKNDPSLIVHEIAKNLDLKTLNLSSCPTYDWQAFTNSFALSQDLLKQAFVNIPENQLQQLRQDFLYLLNELSQLKTPFTQTDPEASIRAMNHSMDIDFNSMLQAMAILHCFFDNRFTLTQINTKKTLPTELQNAIEGNIHSAVKKNNQWIVYGGEGNNRYDMSIINIVYDPDGDDIYDYDQTEPAQIKFVIDQKGKDQYSGQTIGAATGLLGISIIVDHEGDDHYQGTLAANAAGMMGIGLLMDYAGVDIYQGDYFSNGAAFYGAGMLLDLGNESDSYLSSLFSQGFGGPRAYGLIYDYHGNDLYKANGMVPSVYDTPSVYASYSQGFGFGLRLYDSGGIGVIFDQHGNDRYEGGEFSQAGGYYWGLGILHDEHGNDLYYGNRYSQGFGVHQATGILYDQSGHDQYWGMTAACQGAAWDIALGLLIDISGNDSYRGDNLCQGSAAMQAMGWLIDLDGTDHYLSSSTISQGHSGNNTYHYDPESPLFSWSVLLDAGQDHDFYSNKTHNNQTISKSRPNTEDAAESLSHGLFIDTDQILQ